MGPIWEGVIQSGLHEMRGRQGPMRSESSVTVIGFLPGLRAGQSDGRINRVMFSSFLQGNRWGGPIRSTSMRMIQPQPWHRALQSVFQFSQDAERLRTTRKGDTGVPSWVTELRFMADSAGRQFKAGMDISSSCSSDEMSFCCFLESSLNRLIRAHTLAESLLAYPRARRFGVWERRRDSAQGSRPGPRRPRCRTLPVFRDAPEDGPRESDRNRGSPRDHNRRLPDC
jgi:hypothetical protein